MPDLILKNLRMNSRKFAMNYGAVLGLCLVAIASVMWSFGVDKSGSILPTILNNVLIIAGISYSIIQFRDIESSGFISYSESLKLGTTIAFFSSVILAFYTFIFINYIEPNTLNEILQQAEQAILESNPEISDEELDLVLEMTNKFVQPHWMLILGVLGGTFMGFVYSLIISIFITFGTAVGLSFLFFPIGVIFYFFQASFLNIDLSPNTVKLCGQFSLLGFFISSVIYSFSTIFP